MYICESQSLFLSPILNCEITQGFILPVMQQFQYEKPENIFVWIHIFDAVSIFGICDFLAKTNKLCKGIQCILSFVHEADFVFDSENQEIYSLHFLMMTTFLHISRHCLRSESCDEILSTMGQLMDGVVCQAPFSSTKGYIWKLKPLYNHKTHTTQHNTLSLLIWI